MPGRYGRFKRRDEKNGSRLSRSIRKGSGSTEKSAASSVLQLQGEYGNSSLQRMYATGALQAKLKIGRPGDKYEREADSVAERVLNMPESNISRQEGKEEEIKTKPLAGQITPLIQRQAEEEEGVQAQPEEEAGQAKFLQQQEDEEEVQKQPEEGEEPVQGKMLQPQNEEEEEGVQKQPEEEEPVQTKSTGVQTGNIDSKTESGINSIRGGGQPLPESTRTFFEQRFGANFSGVKVHTDSNAAHLARSINAKAFTVGKDVVFGSGQYSPESSSGKQLLAHELTHVVQQNKKGIGKNRIQRWGGSTHAAITETVGKSISFDLALLLELKHYCKNMDLRARRLIRAGWDYITKRPIFTIKPEGPDHGEGGMYKTTNKAKSIRLNVTRQNLYLGRAVTAKKKAQQIIKGVLQGSTSIRGFYKIAKLLYENLGDALHVAQDRGSHGEGVKGYGHSQNKYDCDDPSQNISGLNEAKKNTKDVLTTFNRSIGARTWWQKSFRRLRPLQRSQRQEAVRSVSRGRSLKLRSGQWIFDLQQVTPISLKKKKILNIAFVTKRRQRKIAGYVDVIRTGSFQCNNAKTLIQFKVELQNIRGYDSKGRKVHFSKTIKTSLKLIGTVKFMEPFVKQLCP